MNIFCIYNLLVALFGVGLYKLSKKKLAQCASIFIILIGLFGFVITWFPINTRGTELTYIGRIHIVFVSIISLLTVLSGFFFWFAYKKTNLHLFAKISLFAGLLFTLSRPIAAVNVMSSYAGLYERIPIATFLIWILLTSVLMIKVPNTSN